MIHAIGLSRNLKQVFGTAASIGAHVLVNSEWGAKAAAAIGGVGYSVWFVQRAVPDLKNGAREIKDAYLGGEDRVRKAASGLCKVGSGAVKGLTGLAFLAVAALSLKELYRDATSAPQQEQPPANDLLAALVKEWKEMEAYEKTHCYPETRYSTDFERGVREHEIRNKWYCSPDFN
jgi:hypothetical protein